MAMTYQNFASLGVNLNRQKYGPLDISNVFTSAADLKYYLTKGAFTEGVSDYWYKSATDKVVPYPYEGQVLATVIDGVVNVYSLALDAEGNFVTQEIGAKVEVDGKTIVKDAEGKLSIVAPVDPDEKKTYNFAYANGVYSWVEVDTATAAGQAQAIQGLTDRTVALETTVGNTEHGLVKDVADNTQAIADEATARDAADKVLEGKISEALEAAKKYADEGDADTVYNDAELRGRIEAIEGDYLKEADKYDDTAVLGRVSAIEETIGDAEDGLVKDIADNATAIGAEKTRAEAAEKALSDRIDAIDFVDPDELADAIKDFATTTYVDGEIDKIEEAISNLNHFTAKVVGSLDDVKEAGVLYLIKDESVTGADKYNEYIVVDDAPVLIGDTTTDLSNYYDKDSVDGKVEALEGAIADEVEAREALAKEVEDLKAVDNATQDELDAYKEEVTSAIATAKAEAIADADGKLANKVDASDFETFKGANTTAIAAAKQEAIDAAKAAEEAKGYAVAEEVAETYATKDELNEAVEGVETTLLDYAKTADVNTELAKKIETGAISHSTDEVAEGVTVNGTQMNIVVDAFTKAETRQYVADTISQMTGGESAADVLLALNNYKSDNDERVGSIETKNGEQDTAIAEAKAQADKGVADAAKVASDLATANSAIDANAREIETVKGTLTTVNETLSGKVTNLENKDIELAGQISGLDTAVKGNSTTIGEHTAAISALQAKDTELAGQISGVDAKFAGYYTKSEVDAAVQGAIDAIPDVDLDPYAKTEDVNAELVKKANAADVYTKEEADQAFMTQSEVDDRLNALINGADPEGGKAITNIQNLVKYVEENAGDIAALITSNDANTAKLAGIDTTVTAYVADQLAAMVHPKASEEISVAEDGTLGIVGMNVNKLVQTEGDEIILNGGDAK